MTALTVIHKTRDGGELSRQSVTAYGDITVEQLMRKAEYDRTPVRDGDIFIIEGDELEPEPQQEMPLGEPLTS